MRYLFTVHHRPPHQKAVLAGSEVYRFARAEDKDRHRHVRRLAMVLIIFLVALALSACVDREAGPDAAAPGEPWPINLTDRFEVAWAPYETTDKAEFFSGDAALNYQPVTVPMRVDRRDKLVFLRARLEDRRLPPGTEVLQFPGHVFVWAFAQFRMADGSTIEQVSGREFALAKRALPRAGVNLPVPIADAPIVELLVAQPSAVPINFTALAWTRDAWERHLVNERIWSGVFLGGMFMLALYNLFLAVALRDRSYLYYVGYILSLAAAVFLYSPLLEEYVFPEGYVFNFTLTAGMVAMFFAINFINHFLRVPERHPRLARWSAGAALLGLVLHLLFKFQLMPVTTDVVTPAIHGLLLLGALYFLGMALISYLRGIREARFLVLSIAALIAGLVGFILYTYAVVPYGPLAFHAIEAGALLEGLLLSLALADRVNVIRREKEQAEEAALDTQRHYSRRLLQAQEADREHFASALHDSVGHGLLVIRQGLERMTGGSPAANPRGSSDASPGRRDTALGDVMQQLDEVLRDVRGLSHDLHPHLLRRLGLKTALESTLERAFAHTETEAYADIDVLPARLDTDREITVYRVVQECLNNVIKHARASEVIVRVDAVDGELRVRVKDDGDGFDPATTSDGLGLRAMRERLKLFGGWLAVESAPGEGTQVRFGLPLA